MTNAAGGLTDSYTYDAFGNLVASTGSTSNSYLFAGEQLDAGTGDYYLRQRYYDASTGRFTRRDTFEGNRNNPISLHKYLYGNANPVTYIDPTGLFSIGEANAAISISNILDSIHLDFGQRFIATTLGDEEPSLTSLGWDTLFALGLLASGPVLGIAIALGAEEARAITRVASRVTSRFDLGQCDFCAVAIKTEFQRFGINGTHIRIETVSNSGIQGRIFSKKANDLISTNGYHEAIVVKMNGEEIVFDNIHKTGIPKQQWIDDFETLVPLKSEITLEKF